MSERANLDDTDDLEALVRMIEEAAIAEAHGTHVVARQVIAHAGPGLALLPARLLHFPRMHIRLGLEQPKLKR